MQANTSRFNPGPIKAILILCSLLCSGIAPTFAQLATCESGQAEFFLETGKVRARVLNNGGLFYRGEPNVYEIPAGSGMKAIYAANIWLGGRVAGDLRVAASTYGPWEFWPGPLDEKGKPPEECSDYDAIWEIRTEDILTFLDTGEKTENLLNWPWHLGAPVVDGDGDPDNYNLQGGDYPELLGDQRLWWVMNDRGGEHEKTQSLPLGVEVHGSVFGFDHPEAGGDMTFYEYRIIYKNEVPLEDAYFAIWVDSELGDFGDDYVGSDSLLHLGYTYNADNEDTGFSGYGTSPPAIGVTILGSPPVRPDGIDNNRDGRIDEEGESLGATHVLSTGKGGGGRDGDPERIEDFYNYMQGHWKDQTPLLEGLTGLDWGNWPETLPQNTIRFSYPGDPVTGEFWTEMNPDGSGIPNAPSDKRFVISSGPINIQKGDTLDYRFAIIWARGKDYLDSVTKLKSRTASIRSAVQALYDPVVYPEAFFAGPQRLVPDQAVLGFDQNFPNPFSETTTLRYSIPRTMRIRLAIYDLLGREVNVLADGVQDAGIYAVNFTPYNLARGVYYARIEMDYLRFTRRMVYTR